MSLSSEAKEKIAKELGVPSCEIWNLDIGAATIRTNQTIKEKSDNRSNFKLLDNSILKIKK